MVSMVGFSSGWRDAQMRNERKRREMAMAFEQFRQSNPEANLAEFQNFIDGFSGGRNYIAGGAPSQDVLKGISQRNQQRMAQEAMQRNMASMRSQAQAHGELEAMSRQFLLNHDTPEEARAAFEQQFGPDATSFMQGNMGIDTLFTEERRQAVVGETIREHLPSAIQFIQGSGGQIDAQTLGKAFPGLPKATIKPFIEEAQREFQARQDEEHRQKAAQRAEVHSNLYDSLARNDDFRNHIRFNDEETARAMARERLGPWVEAYGEEMFGDDFLDTIIQQIESNMASAQRLDHQEKHEATKQQRFQVSEQIADRSLEAVNEVFQGSASGAPSEATGRAGVNGLNAAQRLAQMYNMDDPRAMDALMGLFQDRVADGATIEELMEAGHQVLSQNGVQRLHESIQAAQSGMPDMPSLSTFEDWSRRNRESVEEQMLEFQNALVQIEREQDPQRRRAMAIQLRENQGAFLSELNQHIEGARISQESWINVGSGPWNEQAISGGPNSILGIAQTHMERIDRELQQILNLTGRGSEAPEARGERGPVQLMDLDEARNILREVGEGVSAGQAGVPAGPGPGMAISNFIQSAEALEYLRRHPNSVELLRTNPLEWARQAMRTVLGAADDQAP